MTTVSSPKSGDLLINGTMNLGWFGEISADDFITGDALADAIGLDEGTSQNSDAGWLKFAIDGKIVYVAKKPFRRSVSWDDLSLVGAVLGQAIVEIGDNRYKVRLLKGRGDGLDTGVSKTFDGLETRGSEWNRLFYRVSSGQFSERRNRLLSEGIDPGTWAKYDESELLMNKRYGDGHKCWCQESAGDGYRICRGDFGVSFCHKELSSYGTRHLGWRPCLEKID